MRILSKGYFVLKLYISFLVLFILLPNFSFAQFGDPFGRQSNEIQRSPIRKVLNMFSVTVTSGYGLTLYKHDVTGYTLIQKENGELFLIPDYRMGAPNMGYKGWLQSPQTVNDIRYQNEDFLVDTDTTEIGFTGIGSGIPINLSVHLNIDKFRVGGGVSAELHKLSKFSPIAYESEILSFEPEAKNSLFTRWYGTIGYNVHNYWDYSFVPEVQFGKVNMGSNYNNELINKGMFINIGVSVEKNFSEYFRALIRPSFEFKSYEMSFGEAPGILHKQPAFYITAGLSFNYPEVPRCKISSCQTQLKHVHGGKEFRGQPIWKKQNPKYGENHQDLIKYKGKNKRIRSPF